MRTMRALCSLALADSAPADLTDGQHKCLIINGLLGFHGAEDLACHSSADGSSRSVAVTIKVYFGVPLPLGVRTAETLL